MSRGNGKQIIFEDARDRRRFIKILAEAARRHGVQVFVECRMGTHYHLIVRTPHANISEFMNYLNGEYAKYWNRRYQRTGHLFGERFKANLVGDGLYLRVVLSYVMNNPVAGGQARTARDWRWSSYRATIGAEPQPAYLCLDWLETTFPAPTRAEAQDMLERYVSAPSVEDAEIWLAHFVVADDPLKTRIRALIATKLYTASVPRAYRSLKRPPLNELIAFGLSKAERNTAILRAHAVYGYTAAELGRYLGFHSASISRILCSVRPQGEL